METRIARIKTDKACRYLQQMCKHFGDTVSVVLTESAGRIEMPFGICDLTAEPTRLTLSVTAEEPQIGRLQQVIGDHLARFAFRENPTIQWLSAAQRPTERTLDDH